MNDDIAICEFDMHAFFLEKYAIHSSPTTYAYDIRVQYEHIVSKYYLQKVILISSSDAHLFSHTYNSCVT